MYICILNRLVLIHAISSSHPSIASVWPMLNMPLFQVSHKQMCFIQVSHATRGVFRHPDLILPKRSFPKLCLQTASSEIHGIHDACKEKYCRLLSELIPGFLSFDAKVHQSTRWVQLVFPIFPTSSYPHHIFCHNTCIHHPVKHMQQPHKGPTRKTQSRSKHMSFLMT